MIFAIEGGEGSGKGTILQKLKEEFPEFSYYREPGSTTFSEKVRNLILQEDSILAETESLLFLAARLELWKKIREEENQGKVIILDRSAFSSFVYQGIVSGVGVEKLKKLHELFDSPIPDYVLFLKVSPEVGLERIQKNNRETNRFDEKDLSFHKEVLKGYESLKDFFPNIVEIDGEQTPEKVYKQVKKNILSLQNL